MKMSKETKKKVKALTPKQLQYKAACDLLNTHRFLAWQGALYYYVEEKGIYSRAESYVGKTLQLEHSALCDTSMCRNVIDILKRKTEPNKLQEPPINLICLLGCVLDIYTSETQADNPDNVFFAQLPTEFDPNAKCPLFMKFLSEVLPENEHALVGEIIGFCLLRDYRFQKAVLFVGEGANGKSVLLATIKTLLGANNCASASLQSLANNKFAVANLHHKFANICADLSAKEARETGTFKKLTGGDLVDGERKFEHTFSFINFAKLLFSCNSIPPTDDYSNGYFRRWLILEFGKQFEGEDADPNMLDKLTTKEELSGILNFAIAGLNRLLQNNVFSTSATVEEVRWKYLRMSNAVAKFVEECCHIDPTAYVEKQVLFDQFEDWCDKKKMPTMSSKKFFARLRSVCKIEDFQPHAQARCFLGLRLKAEIGKVVEEIVN